MTTDLDTQPKKTQQKMKCALKNAWLLTDGRCCLSDKENEIFFSISISPPLTTIAGLQRVGQWLGLLGHRISHQWTFSMGSHYRSDIHVASGSALDFCCVCFEYVQTFWQTL